MFTHRFGYVGYRMVLPEKEPVRSRRLRLIIKIIDRYGGQPIRKEAVHELCRLGIMYRPIWIRKEKHHANFKW